MCKLIRLHTIEEPSYMGESSSSIIYINVDQISSIEEMDNMYLLMMNNNSQFHIDQENFNHICDVFSIDWNYSKGGQI